MIHECSFDFVTSPRASLPAVAHGDRDEARQARVTELKESPVALLQDTCSSEKERELISTKSITRN